MFQTSIVLSLFGMCVYIFVIALKMYAPNSKMPKHKQVKKWPLCPVFIIYFLLLLLLLLLLHFFGMYSELNTIYSTNKNYTKISNSNLEKKQIAK